MKVPNPHDNVFTIQNADDRGEKLLNMAITYGTKVGIATLGVSSIATYLANQRFTTFRNYGSMNAKVSIPIIISMFVTSVVIELGIHDAREYPEKWDGGKPANLIKKTSAKITDITHLGLHKQMLLHIYDYPLAFAGVLALPVAGRILATRFAKSHLTTSQALMQTRVFAQFGIISILLSTVSVRAFVEANDHFGCRRKQMTDEERYAKGWGEPAPAATSTSSAVDVPVESK